MSLQIFNIQKFSIHDGPGIRTTVFLKGCPLRCLWCQNPESFEKTRQLIVDETKCIGCNECIEFCKNDECILCGDCIELCLQNARSIIGKEIDDDEVIDEIMKDKVFYEESGGGVTFSGGEPLMQTDELLPILKRLKLNGIHIAMDTSGCVTREKLSETIDYVDLYLYDLKVINSEKHMKYTGVDNDRIIENFRYLSNMNKRIWIRIPLIDEINTSQSDIKEFIDMLNGFEIDQINLISYHSMAIGKYQKMGMAYPGKKLKEPSDEVTKKIKMEFEHFGYRVVIGG